MSDSKRRVEAAVGVSSNLLKLLQYLNQSYRLLGEIIEREHVAIRNGDLNSLEEIVQEKVMHVDGIEGSVKDLQGIAGRLLDQLPQDDQLKRNSEVTLTEMIAAFDRLVRSWDVDEFATDVLYRQWDKCQSVLSEMLACKEAVQSKLEVNRRVIAKMQEHQQASHRFWQSVLAEAEQTYTVAGEKKSDANASVIRIQA